MAARREASTRMTEDTKQRSRLQMPLLLLIGMAGSMISSIISGIAIMTLFFSQKSIFWTNGEQVSREQFLSKGGYLLFLVPVLLGAISYGLWKERAWTRHLMVLCWVVLAIPSVGGLLLGTFEGEHHFAALILFPVVIWYLYFKRSVVSYYQAVSAAEQKEGPVYNS